MNKFIISTLLLFFTLVGCTCHARRSPSQKKRHNIAHNGKRGRVAAPIASESTPIKKIEAAASTTPPSTPKRRPTRPTTTTQKVPSKKQEMGLSAFQAEITSIKTKVQDAANRAEEALKRVQTAAEKNEAARPAAQRATGAVERARFSIEEVNTAKSTKEMREVLNRAENAAQVAELEAKIAETK